MGKIKSLAVKASHLVFSLVLVYLASIAIHEYAHLLTLIALGGDGYIYLNMCHVTRWPPVGGWTVYFAGGLGCALFLLLARSIDEDPEDRIALLSVALSQIIYGMFEGVWGLTGIMVYLHVGSVAGHVVLGVVAASQFFGPYVERYVRATRWRRAEI